LFPADESSRSLKLSSRDQCQTLTQSINKRHYANTETDYLYFCI
jgi:hypothetical protein